MIETNGSGQADAVLAQVRQRRLRRRHARRTAVRIATVATVVMGGAALLAPERAPEQATLTEWRPFRIEPLWRPAVDLLDETTPVAPWLDGLRPESERSDATREIVRWDRIFSFSKRYSITTDLAGAVYDAAVAESIDPELAFRLVELESRFDPGAVSYAGAVGLTQLMPSTARWFEPGITEDELFDPETNLRIGFRYLRTLIRERRGNLRLALLTYNRGPVAVNAALALGEDPANGYDRRLLRGYRGSGVID